MNEVEAQRFERIITSPSQALGFYKAALAVFFDVTL